MNPARRPAIQDKLEWAVEFCRRKGLRRTPALRTLLSYLLRYQRPISWAVLSKERAISRVCDPSSAFRVLVKLEEIGLVRRMGSPDRSYYFMLVLPGVHHDYLICKDCGKIENLEIECPVEKLEKRITTSTGYSQLYHELDFFGVCPDCQTA